MTAQSVEGVAHLPATTVRALDPDSPEGRDAAQQLGRICASVIDRLRAEGQPIPGEPSP